MSVFQQTGTVVDVADEQGILQLYLCSMRFSYIQSVLENAAGLITLVGSVIYRLRTSEAHKVSFLMQNTEVSYLNLCWNVISGRQMCFVCIWHSSMLPSQDVGEASERAPDSPR